MIQQSDLTELSRQIIYSVRNEVYPLLNLIRLEVRENPNSASIQHLFYYLYGKMIEKNEYASLQYIRTHYHEDISIHQLAQLENYTPAYFVKWFRDKTGCSPSAYLRRFRVERAKALLGSTSYSILEIALLVGYNSHAALSRAFRTVTGITPQEYRKSVSRI